MPTSVHIAWHDDDRETLRPLFALAEDSAAALDRYMSLGRVLVARAGDAIVGHLQLVDGDTPETLEVQSLAVDEGHRHHGIGRALMEHATAVARAEGRSTLLVATATANVINLRFYQRLGYRMLRVDRDAFTAAHGYPDGIVIDGIPLRDRVWLTLAL